MRQCAHTRCVAALHRKRLEGGGVARVSSIAAMAAMLAVLLIAGVLRPTTAVADDTTAAQDTTLTDYDTWTAVSHKVSSQLAAALAAYTAGDRSTASSQVSSTRNITYTSSNFVAAVDEVLGPDREQRQTSQFQSIQQLTYASGHDGDLTSQIAALDTDLKDAAASLDASGAVGSPREYAKVRDERTRQQRQRLQAEKKTKFTGKGNRTWTQVAKDMEGVLNDALKAAQQGDGRKGSDKVNEAYYQYYEKLGFEKNVMNAISGSRVSLVESRFKETRKAMIAGEPIATITKQINDLSAMLLEDAQKLDGGAADRVNGFTKFITSSFGQAFVILIREGLEALLVVAAIIAYLVKSGNKQLVKWIYLGVVAGLVASGIMAMVFGRLFSGSGPQQEVMEGVVALIAMLMLLYTSNWMLSKSSVDAWQKYIKDKTQNTVKTLTSAEQLTVGGVVSLAMLSFLAVFREGAETVMFYQSIYSMTRDSAGMWAGGLAAAVGLVIVFIVFRFTTIKIPIHQFFIATSVLMAVLVVMFAGGGVHSLIEGDALSGIYLSGLPTNEWIGFYPYVETVVAQGLAVVAVVALYLVFWIKERKAHAVSNHTNH